MNVRRYSLIRHVDDSGVSGIGRVAEGVILPNDTAVLWWLVPPHSVQVYRSVEDLLLVHGHGKKETTTIQYE
jgi:hypothetical protein